MTQPAAQAPGFAQDADIAIVGAGAAGLATAIFIHAESPAREGAAEAPRVLLLDAARKPGAKILVSGGSRCNVTNLSVRETDFWSDGSSAVIRRVLRAFPVPDTVAWFRRLGVPLHEEADGKLFPDSHRARDVLDALLGECDRLGIRLAAAARVTGIRREPDGFALTTAAATYRAGAVVLAAGGMALPKSGSDGSGFGLAAALGHSLVPPTPALAPLVLESGTPSSDGFHSRLSGVAHPAELTVWVDGAVQVRLTGPLLWTHFGVSGPVALNASRHIERARLRQLPLRVTVGFLPGRRFEEVHRELVAAGTSRAHLSVLAYLSRELPASVADALLTRVGIPAHQRVSQLPRGDRQRLTHSLTEWELPVSGTRGYTFAETTAGGVPLAEIDPATMESRCCAGLFFAGEIVDVDGRLGGYNFQWAWSSARVAGRALARRHQDRHGS